MRLFKLFLKWRKFATHIQSFELKKTDVEELRSYRNTTLEDRLYDACKKKLFTEFSEGKATKDFCDGYLTALSSHRGLSMKKGLDD